MIYSWIELFFSVLFLILGIIILICWFKSEDKDFIFIIFVIVSWFIGVLMFGDAFKPSTPTNEDVLNKKAEYVKTITITDNDTIETYHIKWKEEFIK